MRADGGTYEAHFVKVAVNVVRQPKTEDDLLPGLLRKWFGPDAGLPGTTHHVVFVQRGDILNLSPLFRRDVRLELWRSYAREEIPPLFGLTFNRAVSERRLRCAGPVTCS